MGLCHSNEGIYCGRVRSFKKEKYFRKSVSSKNVTNELELNNDVIISESNQNPEKIYKKEKLLGVGSFGEVWLVKNILLDKNFAMKIIKKTRRKNEEQDIKNEIQILKELDHPKILKVLEFYITQYKYYIITDYCPEGDLFNEIRKMIRFNEGDTAFIIYQLLQTIKYCHKMHIIHRDIKPENVMIEKRESNGCLQVKLIDFGTAKIFQEKNKENGLVGSSYYMAPEVIKRKYNEKCDLWSIGVIMYILLIGKPPFDGETDKEIIKKVEKGDFNKTDYPFNTLSNNAKDLIDKLMTYDPKKRISAEDALQHPWFKSEIFLEKNKVNNISKELADELLKNIANYKSDNMLKCATLAYLVHHNSNIEEYITASKLYNNIDTQHNGKIEKFELEKGLEEYLNLDEEDAKNQAETIFKNIDNDHNGYIEYEEFVRAAINPKIFLKENYLRFAFNYFDIDGSGGIDFNEILQKFTQNERNKSCKIENDLKIIFEKIDINNDGTLSFEEFCKMMEDIIES